MTNYQNGKIYLITSPSTDKVYVGSTVNSLSARLRGHRAKPKENCSSREIIDLGNYVISLLHDFPCNTREELLQEEQRVMELYPNKVNYMKAFQTEAELKQYANEQRIKYYKKYPKKCAEQSKAYYEANKDKINKQSLKRYEENKQEIKKIKNTVHTCECGKTYTHANKARHNKTKIHLEHFKTIL